MTYRKLAIDTNCKFSKSSGNPPHKVTVDSSEEHNGLKFYRLKEFSGLFLRSSLRKLALPIIAALLCVPLAGCPAPNQDAIAINSAGAICAVVLTNDGDATGATSCVTISGQLATAIKNFVPGSSAQNIVQLGNDLVAIIHTDTNSKAADEIAIILGTILNIVGEYSAPPTNVADAVTAIADAHVARPANTGPRTKAELYAAYNAALVAHPVAGLKPLK